MNPPDSDSPGSSSPSSPPPHEADGAMGGDAGLDGGRGRGEGPPGLPPLPDEHPAAFRTTVHGTLFGEREKVLDSVRTGDVLLLIPDPPIASDPDVWVHRASGDPVGRLPPEIGAWLAPWLLSGGHARARAERVSGPETPSWRRLLLSVHCGPRTTPG